MCNWSTSWFMFSIYFLWCWSYSHPSWLFGGLLLGLGGGYLLPPCSGLSSYDWHRRALTREKLTGNKREPPVAPIILMEDKKKQVFCGYKGGLRAA